MYVDLPLLKVAGEARRSIEANMVCYCPVCGTLRPSYDAVYPGYLERGGVLFNLAAKAQPQGMAINQSFVQEDCQWTVDYLRSYCCVLSQSPLAVPITPQMLICRRE